MNSGGLNVYSLEVEHVVLGYPSVAACAVVRAPDAQFGETAAAFVQPLGGASIAIDDIETHCRVHLAGYKCSWLIPVVDLLPRNAMGKVDKVLLRRTLWSGSDRQIAGQ